MDLVQSNKTGLRSAPISRDHLQEVHRGAALRSVCVQKPPVCWWLNQFIPSLQTETSSHCCCFSVHREENHQEGVNSVINAASHPLIISMSNYSVIMQKPCAEENLQTAETSPLLWEKKQLNLCWVERREVRIFQLMNPYISDLITVFLFCSVLLFYFLFQSSW